MIQDKASESVGLDYFAGVHDLTSNLDGAEVIRGFLAGIQEEPKMIVHGLNALHSMRVDLTRETYGDGMERIIARVQEILCAADDTAVIHIEHVPNGEA